MLQIKPDQPLMHVHANGGGDGCGGLGNGGEGGGLGGNGLGGEGGGDGGKGGGGDESAIVPMPGVTPVAVLIWPMLLFLMKLFSSTVALVFRMVLNWSANICARVFWATS